MRNGDPEGVALTRATHKWRSFPQISIPSIPPSMAKSTIIRVGRSLKVGVEFSPNSFSSPLSPYLSFSAPCAVQEPVRGVVMSGAVSGQTSAQGSRGHRAA